MKVKSTYLKNWFKEQILLGVFVSLSMLTIFVPNQAKAAEGTPAPLSISAIPLNCALQPVLFKPSDCLHLVKPNKNDAHGKKLSAHPVSSSPIHRYFISNLGRISSYLNNFDSVFGRDFRQACQLLDLPPPCAMVSF